MGIGPQQAILRALQRAGIDLDEVGLIEINEAFAPQVLACLKLLGLDSARTRGSIPMAAPLPSAIRSAPPVRAWCSPPPAGCNASSALRGGQPVRRARPGRGDGDRALPMRHRSP